MQAAISTPAMITPFQITVKNCATPPASGNVKGQFSTAGYFNSTTNALLNTASGGDKAAGFQVEETRTVIDFKSATPQSEEPYDTTAGATFNYTVGYLYIQARVSRQLARLKHLPRSPQLSLTNRAYL